MPESELNSLYEAKYVTEYLEEYLDNHTYTGSTLRSRIRFGWSVTYATRPGNGKWVVSCNNNESSTKLAASKLIVASGTTSIPNIPRFKNEGFSGRILHLMDFASACTKGLLSGSPKHICVLGGGKSAADMAYKSAKAGHVVSWLIRKDGHGPGLLATPKKIGPYANAVELAMTRVVGTFSPSFLAKDTWWMRFLHNTRPGRWLQGKIFQAAEQDVFKTGGFDREDRQRNGFPNLKPDVR